MKTILLHSLCLANLLTSIPPESGAQWVPTNDSLVVPGVLTFASNFIWGRPINLMAGSIGRGVFFSNNNGLSWGDANAGLESYDVHAVAVGGGHVLAGTTRGVYYAPISLYLEDNPMSFNWGIADSGLTWNSSGQAFVLCPDGAGGTNIFAGTKSGIYLSTDDGRRWHEADSGLTNRDVRTLAYAPDSLGGMVFAGTSCGEVFRSSNNGGIWSEADTGLTHEFSVHVLSVSSGQTGRSVLFAGTDSGGLYLSTDMGKTWTISGLSSKQVYALATTPVGTSGTNVYAGTGTAGVFLSTDLGKTWSPLNDGLGDSVVTALAIYPDDSGGANLFAGTYNAGIWKLSLPASITGVVQQTDAVLSGPKLFQNYPNPFNPTTTFHYELNERSKVKLSVFNTLGQLVSTLVNDEEQAGAHEAKFDGLNLASGIYFYRLTAGSFVKTMKCLLMK